MEKPPEFNTTNMSYEKNDSDDENIDLLVSQRVDEITGNQINRIEVQKMEDILTISTLEREFEEKKRKLMHSKSRYEDAKKKIASQTKTINQLFRAYKGMVDKFEEVKQFQNEVILNGVDSAEKKFVDGKSTNNELFKIFHLIEENENKLQFSKESIAAEIDKLNVNVQLQLKEKNTVINVISEKIKQLEEQWAILNLQIKQEISDLNVQDELEAANKRMIQLEADKETLEKKIKDGIDDLAQEKQNKLQESESRKKDVKDTEEVLSNLLSDISSNEENQSKLNQILEIAKSENEEILREVSRKREINSLSSQAQVENIQTLTEEYEKLSAQLGEMKSKFNKMEAESQFEMSTLHNKCEERKKYLKELESCRSEVSKLKEINLKKQQQEVPKDKFLDENLIQLNEEYEQYKLNIQLIVEKQAESDQEIGELQEKIHEMNEKIESIAKMSANSSTQSSSSTQFSQLEKTATKTYQNPGQKSASSASVSNTPSSKQVKTSGTPQKKPTYNLSDSDDDIDERFNVKTSDDASSSYDKLFGESSPSNSPTRSAKKPKDENVFKVPHHYATPIRKRGAQNKK